MLRKEALEAEQGLVSTQMNGQWGIQGDAEACPAAVRWANAEAHESWIGCGPIRREGLMPATQGPGEGSRGPGGGQQPRHISRGQGPSDQRALRVPPLPLRAAPRLALRAHHFGQPEKGSDKPSKKDPKPEALDMQMMPLDI